uniref:hypothetical protein n=1 Tax=Corynebacterium riegelii TaxID=156976 RepID=UPI00288C4CFF
VVVRLSRDPQFFAKLCDRLAVTNGIEICDLSTLMQWNSHLAIPPPQPSKKPLDIPSKNLLDSVSKKSLDITELGLTSGGNTKLSSGKCVRITIYAHDPTDRVFIPLGRRSTNPRFRDFGRKFYPDDQGLISRAWETGWGVETDLPAQKDQWVDEVSERHSIPTEVAKQFRLRARSLAALRLQVGREKAGVIVIESDDPKGIGGNVVDDYRSSRAYDELRALMPILVARNDFEHRKTNSYTSGSTVI